MKTRPDVFCSGSLQSHCEFTFDPLTPRKRRTSEDLIIIHAAWKMYSAYSVFSLSRLPNWRRGLIPWMPPGGSVDGKENRNLALLEKISQEVVNQTCLHASMICWVCWLLSFAFTSHWLPELNLRFYLTGAWKSRTKPLSDEESHCKIY